MTTWIPSPVDVEDVLALVALERWLTSIRALNPAFPHLRAPVTDLIGGADVDRLQSPRAPSSSLLSQSTIRSPTRDCSVIWDRAVPQIALTRGCPGIRRCRRAESGRLRPLPATRCSTRHLRNSGGGYRAQDPNGSPPRAAFDSCEIRSSSSRSSFPSKHVEGQMRPDGPGSTGQLTDELGPCDRESPPFGFPDRRQERLRGMPVAPERWTLHDLHELVFSEGCASVWGVVEIGSEGPCPPPCSAEHVPRPPEDPIGCPVRKSPRADLRDHHQCHEGPDPFVCRVTGHDPHRFVEQRPDRSVECLPSESLQGLRIPRRFGRPRGCLPEHVFNLAGLTACPPVAAGPPRGDPTHPASSVRPEGGASAPP